MAICVEMTCLYAPAVGSALILSLGLCSIPGVTDIGTLFPQAALRILCYCCCRGCGRVSGGATCPTAPGKALNLASTVGGCLH